MQTLCWIDACIIRYKIWVKSFHGVVIELITEIYAFETDIILKDADLINFTDINEGMLNCRKLF